MYRRTFTQEQIKALSRNKSVARCGTKSVRYTKGFKMSALKQYNEDGLNAVEIFEAASIDLTAIGMRAPNRLMNQWNTALKPKRICESAPKEQDIEVKTKRARNGKELRNLKAKVAYLEAENRFLARLRAGKRQ